MAVKKSELYSMLWEACNKLRGGVEPARYKDYVLVLLFFKYVSDRYKGQPFSEFTVTPGASFDDLIAAKGKSDVGERVDKIIQKFLEDNKLQGSLPDVSFNNPEELGSGKELVDKVSGLIAVFQNPAIDFKNNRASGDDIIGDAYEYFMMKFAQESGKSKGQFYTPSEVSRIIAHLIGIGNIKQSSTKKWTLYDPAAGSGSLLIRAADEAPVDHNGDSIVTIFGQEKDLSTAGLAKMNLILHQKGTGEIKRGNTLADPAFLDDFGELKKFDFIVMNPPFSDKSWSDGIKPAEDRYKRFNGCNVPQKNGDYAWFLHVLKSLDSNGKAGIIMPHGVLFRGNAEETIRIDILKKKAQSLYNFLYKTKETVVNKEDDIILKVENLEKMSAQSLLQELMGPNYPVMLLQKINELYNNINMSHGLVNLMIIKVYASKGSIPALSYFEKMAKSWQDNGIFTTYDAIEKMNKPKTSPRKKNSKDINLEDWQIAGMEEIMKGFNANGETKN